MAKKKHAGSLGKIVLTGESGRKYRFTAYPFGTKFRKRGGVFVITRRSRKADGQHGHLALYVGQTEDFSQPVEPLANAKRLRGRGANCICLQSDDSEKSRLEKEKDIVAAYHRLCNG
jgi:hypothetical protein